MLAQTSQTPELLLDCLPCFPNSLEEEEEEAAAAAVVVVVVAGDRG